jgi:membrane-bound ClpP family serine protease
MLYLFSPMEQAKAALAGAVIAGIFCLILPFIVKDLPAKSWLGAALLGKAMFVPEIIMNAFLYQSYALNVYLLFSFAMLIVTSIYAWFGLYLLIKDRTVTLFAGGLCAVLEGIFFADLFATIYLLVTDNAARLAGKKMQEEQKQKKPSSFSWNDPKRMRRKKAD